VRATGTTLTIPITHTHTHTHTHLSQAFPNSQRSHCCS
jgi:hypothetical protein